MSTEVRPILEVRNLGIAFSRLPVVRDLSFSISAGKTLAVVGESGSGKSVTGLAIMRLLPQQGVTVNGAILFEGRDVLGLTEAQMQRMRGNRLGMIFQEPMTSLNPVMRVGDQLAEAVLYHRGLSWSDARNEARRLLDRVRIPDAPRRLRQYPHTFSGGMRQRVMIAMALACNPRLIIADEPTTALDVTIQAQILDLLRTLQAETGVGILFITHDMGVVAEMADEVLVMRRGELIEHGMVQSIFRAPKNEYTRSLIAASPTVPPTDPDASAAAPATASKGEAQTAIPGLGERDTVLAVERLVVRFPIRGGRLGRVQGEVHAVEDVTFGIGAGETLGLVGESGCGKSTIGRSIINLVRADEGAVLLNGRELDFGRAEDLSVLRRSVQMIFQDPYGSLDARQTIGSAIVEPMLTHKLAGRAEAHEKMQHLLQRVGLLPEHADRLPHEFSGGQRQRICIARALSVGPKVLIADEAVSALDVTIKAQIVALLMDLQQEFGLAYLFISHDIAVVERMCQRVAVMFRGEIVEIGPGAAVIGTPAHPYTRRLLAAVPIADPTVRRQPLPIPESELLSPVWPVGYRPPPHAWRKVGAKHFVQTRSQ